MATPSVEEVAPLMRRGDEAVAHDDIASAAILYQSAHLADPASREAMRRLGAAELALGQYSDAFKTYHALQQIAPSDAEGAFRMGELQLMRGMPQQAIDQFNVALKARKGDPTLYSAIGVAYSMMGKFDLAVDNYRAGLKMTPNDFGLRNNLGLAQYGAGDAAGAIKTFSELVAMPNAKPRYRQTLAMIYLAQARSVAGSDRDFALLASEVNDFRAQQTPGAMGLADGRSIVRVLLTRDAAIKNLTEIIAADHEHPAAEQATTTRPVTGSPSADTTLPSPESATPKASLTLTPVEPLAALPAVKVATESLPSSPKAPATPLAGAKAQPIKDPTAVPAPKSTPAAAQVTLPSPPAKRKASVQAIVEETPPIVEPEPRTAVPPAPIVTSP
ncbi:MAG TPA: tetratricopeptide repeat protein [Stellaceae bacterium]|nr:tetratricopeptide repeat protein [Stellaceae bacterium]